MSGFLTDRFLFADLELLGLLSGGADGSFFEVGATTFLPFA